MSRSTRRADPRSAKVRRGIALSRIELRSGDSCPREAPGSPMAPFVKVTDPETRRIIDEALRAREGHHG